MTAINAVEIARRPHGRMIHVRLDPDLHRRLRMLAAADDTSLQDWVEKALDRAATDGWHALKALDQ